MAADDRVRGTGIFLATAAGSVAAVLALTATALAQAPAGGLAAPPAAPQWIKLCSPDPTTKKNNCLIQQQIYADTGQFIASATIRTTQDDPKMQFIVGVPPGMMLPPGIRMQIDDAKTQSVLPYSICFSNTCFADLDINADFVKAMRAGKQLTFIAIEGQGGQTVSFPISLTGFVKAYDGASIDPNTPAGQTAIDALSASLKAHADEARQRLIDQQATRPGQ